MATPPVSPLSLSVIVPVFENPGDLANSLNALARSSYRPAEVLVVDDGSGPEAAEIASVCDAHEARRVRLERNLGPATARNAGAKASSGEILVFLDADVVVHPDTLQRFADRLTERPDLDALFGAYDDCPAASDTVSQFRNLLHHYIHLRSAGRAITFWAGCGAMRRDVFDMAGGFPESYTQPSIEDVEFGHRLSQAGFVIELDPSIQVTHAKRWTLGSMFRTDLLRRAAPWAERFWLWGGLPNNLNFDWKNRISVLLAGVGLLALTLRWPLLSLCAAAAILTLNVPVYRFIASKLGARAVPISMLAHLAHFCAGFLGLLLGSWRFFRKRDPFAVSSALCLLAVAAGLQLATGAYTADFSSHPDESGHFVTAVAVGRFLDHPFQSPMAFARRMYAQYPKVALGHWPPLGYILQAVWMRAAGEGRTQALLLLLLAAVLAALTVYELSWPGMGRPLAMGAAVLWLVHGAVQQNYESVMMDIPVALLCLLALAAFRHYVGSPSANASLTFGFLAAMGLLVKANAIVVALLPPAYVVLARRWDLPRRRDFWLAPLLVLLLAAPWYGFATFYFQRNFAAWAGLPHTPGAAVRFNWSVWWRMSGVPLIAGSISGAFVAVWRTNRSGLLWAALLAGSLGADAVLRAMGEPRHLLVALSAMLALSFLALREFPRPAAALGAAILLFSVWSFRPAPHRGYRQAAQAIERGPAGHVLLSGPGDGAVIASAVLQPGSDARFWLRATKLLGNVAWSGVVIAPYVRTAPAVREMLVKYGVNQVYLDPPSPGDSLLFDRLLRENVQQESEWRRVALPGRAQLFRRVAPLPAAHVSFYLPRLGRPVGDDGPGN